MKYLSGLSAVSTVCCALVYLGTSDAGSPYMTLGQSISYGLGLVFFILTIVFLALAIFKKNDW